ncbi:unnamed protein product [Owenia fusiformis]|uniref:Uncharacterized protein n=1 Tax=Owenia fusiformis TaxID=6347 RepID=A0A8S4PRU1_OWEFU|nr:unnamed protein product [Owenia fusiformis]
MSLINYSLMSHISTMMSHISLLMSHISLKVSQSAPNTILLTTYGMPALCSLCIEVFPKSHQSVQCSQTHYQYHNVTIVISYATVPSSLHLKALIYVQCSIIYELTCVLLL